MTIHCKNKKYTLLISARCRPPRSTLTGDQTMQVVRYPAGKPWISLQLPKTLKADHSYQLKLNFSRPVLTEVQNKE